MSEHDFPEFDFDQTDISRYMEALPEDFIMFMCTEILNVSNAIKGLAEVILDQSEICAISVNDIQPSVSVGEIMSTIFSGSKNIEKLLRFAAAYAQARGKDRTT